MKTTVLCEDGTIGVTREKDVEIGEVVEIELHDENGNNFSTSGIVEEVLEEKEDWE